jgi:hypothetical protein
MCINTLHKGDSGDDDDDNSNNKVAEIDRYLKISRKCRG